MRPPRQFWPTKIISIIPWIILVFTALNIVLIGGKRKAFGVFIAQLHKEYPNVTLAELNWVGTSYVAFGFLTSGVSAAAILYFSRRYGLFQCAAAVLILLSCVTSAYVPNPHWLFLTHTFMHGIGSSIIHAISAMIIQEYFNHKHPYHILATTLISGGSIATILFVSLFAYVIEQSNWRITFIIFGVAYFIIIGSTALIYRRNEDLSISDIKVLNFQYHMIRKTQIPLLVLWSLYNILMSVVVYGLILNLTDYLYRVNPQLLRSSILTTLFASGETVCFILTVAITTITKTILKDKLGYILVVTSLCACVSLITMEFTSTNVSLQRVLCFIVGFCLTFWNAFLFPAGEELTKLPGHIAYWLSLFSNGFGSLLSPLLIATIAELFNYKWFFLINSAMLTITTSSIVIMKVILFVYGKYDIVIEYDHGKDLSDEDAILSDPDASEDVPLLPNVPRKVD